jgi:hypothetical protein
MTDLVACYLEVQQRFYDLPIDDDGEEDLLAEMFILRGAMSRSELDEVKRHVLTSSN